MKLPKVTSNDPVERLAVSVRQSTNLMLEAYRARYKEIYGEEIERSHLVEELLRNFMTSDKDFMKVFEAPTGDKKSKVEKEPGAKEAAK